MATTLTIAEQQVFYERLTSRYDYWVQHTYEVELRASQAISAGNDGLVSPAPTDRELPWNVPPQTDPTKPAQGVDWAFEKAFVEAYGYLEDLRNKSEIAVARRLALMTPDTDFADVAGQIFGDHDVPSLTDV